MPKYTLVAFISPRILGKEKRPSTISLSRSAAIWQFFLPIKIDAFENIAPRHHCYIRFLTMWMCASVWQHKNQKLDCSRCWNFISFFVRFDESRLRFSRGNYAKWRSVKSNANKFLRAFPILLWSLLYLITADLHSVRDAKKNYGIR